MVLDPKRDNLFFQHYQTSSFHAGAGFEGVVEQNHPILIQSASFDPTADSEKSKEARARIGIATINLPEHRKQYDNFSTKFLQASKVAKTIKMHSSINRSDESKNFIDLGFNVETISAISKYGYDSLGLNYQSVKDFDDLSMTPITKLENVLEKFVVRNFLRNLFTENFFTDDKAMSDFKLQKNDDEISFTDRDNQSSRLLASYDEFVDLISKTFDLDDYRVNHSLNSMKELNFLELADIIHEIYNESLSDNH